MKNSDDMRKRSWVGIIGVLGFVGLSACDKQDDGLTARLLEANNKNVACQKELAEAKAARDSLKKQLAVAMTNPGKIQLTDPEIIELVASARKEKGQGPEIGQGDLNPKEASAIVMRGAPALQQCYERALKRNPNLSGKVVIHWTITQAGTVSGVDVEQDTLGDAEVASCIKSLVARWRFPAPSGGSVEVSFPFVFQSSQ